MRLRIQLLSSAFKNLTSSRIMLSVLAYVVLKWASPCPTSGVAGRKRGGALDLLLHIQPWIRLLGQRPGMRNLHEHKSAPAYLRHRRRSARNSRECRCARCPDRHRSSPCPARRLPERRVRSSEWPLAVRSHYRCVVQHLNLSNSGAGSIHSANLPHQVPDVRTKSLDV